MQVPLSPRDRTLERTAPATIGRWVAIACLLSLVVAGVAAPAAAHSAAPGQAASAPAAPGQAAPPQAPAPAAGPAASGHVSECAAEPPADHADPEGNTSDVIGYVDGYWYNESIDVDASDDLSEEEAQVLIARTAARVEAIRCQTFDEVPPVRTLTREEFRADINESFQQWENEDVVAFQRARLSTMLLVGTEADTVEVLKEHETSFPAAFYDLEEEYIGIITSSPDAIEIDEVTLAHELNHALQDQNFENVGDYNRSTNDRNAAVLALIEGDSRFVDYRYEQACDGGWNGECIRQQGGSSGDPANWGLLLNDFYPYTDGFAFVQHRYREGGWAAVNEVYRNPPTTTLETTYPERYGETEAVAVEVPDRSSEAWERINVSRGPNYDVVGQHGLTSMLIAPTYESGGSTNIIQPQAFLTDHPRDQLDFDQPQTDGWRGDRIYAYRNGEAVGAVWTIAWANATEAGEFASAYERLIEFRGGQQSDAYENVYTFSGDYEMALAIEQDGDRLRIVTAPTVDDLTAVHGDLTLVENGSDGGNESGGNESGDGDGGNESDGSTDGDGGAGDGSGGSDADGEAGTDGSDSVPGFGVLAALVAVAAALGLRRR